MAHLPSATSCKHPYSARKGSRTQDLTWQLWIKGEKASLAKMVLAKLQNSQVAIRESGQRKSHELACRQAQIVTLSRALARLTASPRASIVIGQLWK